MDDAPVKSAKASRIPAAKIRTNVAGKNMLNYLFFLFG
jgi:hypothetical protein